MLAGLGTAVTLEFTDAQELPSEFSFLPEPKTCAGSPCKAGQASRCVRSKRNTAAMPDFLLRSSVAQPLEQQISRLGLQAKAGPPPLLAVLGPNHLHDD